MFDQTFLTNTGKRRPWTYAVGLMGELLALGFLMLLPLIYTDRMPIPGLSQLSITAPRRSTPEPPRSAPSGRQAVRLVRTANQNALFAPIRVPDRTPVLIDPVDTSGGPAVPESGFLPWDGSGSGRPNPLAGMPNPSHVAPPPKPADPPKKAAEPAKIERVIVGGKVQEAMIVRRVIPLYPPLARQARVEGVVRLEGIISRDGTIQQLRVISGHPLLVNAALDAVRQWVYRPTLLNGNPVEVQAPIEVNFTLSK